MMWIDADDADRKRKQCFRLERLHDEKGECFGSVMQYERDSKPHAFTATEPLGTYATFDQAKAAVEMRAGV